MITYDRLWETMKKRGITQYHLIKHEKFSAGQIGRLKNNLTVSTQTLDTLCRLLSCRIEDIVTYIPDNGEPLPEPEPQQAMASENEVQNTPDTDTVTDMDPVISKEKKVPSLYGKARKGIKISKKASKKASKGDKWEKTEKSDKAEKGEKKSKKKNKDKDKDKDKKPGD